jgi:hypothetical protein
MGFVAVEAALACRRGVQGGAFGRRVVVVVLVVVGAAMWSHGRGACGDVPGAGFIAALAG